MSNDQAPRDFGGVKERLEEIAQAVSDESLPLDEALDLYEEAVALGLKASDLLEEGIRVDQAELEGDEADAAGTAAVADGDVVAADTASASLADAANTAVAR